MMDKEEKFWKKFLESEVTKTVAIIVATMAVTSYFNNPTAENERRIQALEDSNKVVADKVQNIKDNDIHEIHLSTSRIEDNQIEQGKQIIELQTIIKERIPTKK